MRTVRRIVESLTRKSRAGPPSADWRTDAQRTHDGGLLGTWWRCRTHGLTDDATILGVVAYCPADDCTQVVLLVCSGRQEDPLAGNSWGFGTATPRTPPTIRFAAQARHCDECGATISPGRLYVGLPVRARTLEVCVECARGTGRRDVLALLAREGLDAE